MEKILHFTVISGKKSQDKNFTGKKYPQKNPTRNFSRMKVHFIKNYKVRFSPLNPLSQNPHIYVVYIWGFFWVLI